MSCGNLNLTITYVQENHLIKKWHKLHLTGSITNYISVFYALLINLMLTILLFHLTLTARTQMNTYIGCFLPFWLRNYVLGYLESSRIFDGGSMRFLLYVPVLKYTTKNNIFPYHILSFDLAVSHTLHPLCYGPKNINCLVFPNKPLWRRKYLSLWKSILHCSFDLPYIQLNTSK